MENPRTVALYIVSVLMTVVGVVVLLVLVFGGDDSVTPSSSVTPTSLPAANLPSSPSSHEGGGEPMEESVHESCVPDIDTLRERSESFAVAWKTLLPGDTTEDRESRLREYVVDGFFGTSQNSVEINPENIESLSLAEQRRINEGISRKAEASEEEVEVFCSTIVSDEATTTATVLVWTEDADGQILLAPYPVDVTIRWKYTDSTWRATLVT